MNNMETLFLIPLGATFLFSFFLTPFFINLFNKAGLVDDPKKNLHPKVIHTYPVPRGGGLPIFIAILLSVALFVRADWHLAAIILGAIVIVILGIIDDKLNLNPYLRFAVQIVSAILPVAAGVGIGFINNPLGGIINLNNPIISGNIPILSNILYSDIFSVLWIVFLMNILNMGAKGVDGQLPGVTAIASLVIAFLSLSYSADIAEWPVITLAAIVAGSFLGFIKWNFFPQKIMPGFSGGSLAGYFLSVLAILSTAKVGTLLVCLGIPIVDTGYTIVRRIMAGKSPVWGDANHLHHKLLRAGMSKRQVSAAYWIFTFILGVFALNLNASYKFYTIIGVTLFVGGLLFSLSFRQKNEQ
jgi:UDP-GlcNAc:undecaprenyl-phosphate GlcNAc-1-phosphate transferase